MTDDWMLLRCSVCDDDPEEDYELSPCGLSFCEGCYICSVCESMHQRLWLPIYGPVNRDGAPLGFLLLA
jgi:hypothetical protein